jgi:hypothetical protein
MNIGVEISKAIVSLQKELKAVDKSATNPFYKNSYAPLPEVRELLQPLLEKNKLALIAVPTILENENGLRFYLIHESGEHITGEWKLNPVKNDPQSVGSAVTYLRRYGDMAMTGLVADEDDDGNAGSAKKKQPEPPKASTARPATANQLDLIKTLGEGLGKDEKWLVAVYDRIHSAADASSIIQQLKDMKKE